MENLGEDCVDEGNQGESPEKKTSNSKKRKTRWFETYLSKILKTKSKCALSSNARQQLNRALCVISRFLSTRILELTLFSDKKTISRKEVESTARLILPESLSSLLLDQEEDIPRIIPPSILEKFLRGAGVWKVSVCDDACVCLAECVEGLCSKILELSSALCTSEERSRITIRDIELSTRQDSDLNSVFRDMSIVFLGGGVVPKIHPLVSEKRPRKKAVDSASSTPSAKSTPRAPDATGVSEAPKPHRFRPGTVALREIRKLQKMYDFLILPRGNFEKGVKTALEEQEISVSKISKDLYLSLQHYVEQSTVDLLRDSIDIAVHSGRVKLTDSDIRLACKIRGEVL